MDIFVGNFPFETTEQELSEVFSAYGPVDRVKIVMDRETGRPRGFGFVTMSDFKAAQAAIKGLDGQEMNGRPLRVNQARGRDDGPPRRNY